MPSMMSGQLFCLLMLALVFAEWHIRVSTFNDIVSKLHKLLNARGLADEPHHAFTLEIIEGKHGCCTYAIQLEGKILLRHGLSLEIDDLDVAFNINRIIEEMFTEIVLHARLVKDIVFHIMTEGAVFLFEKKQDSFLAFLARPFEFLGEIIQRLVKEMLVRVPWQVSRGGKGTQGNQCHAENCAF